MSFFSIMQTSGFNFNVFLLTLFNLLFVRRYWVSPLLTGIVFIFSATFLIWVLIYRNVLYCKYQQLLKEPTSDWRRSQSMISHLKELKNSTIPSSYGLRNILITVAMMALFLSTIFQPVSSPHTPTSQYNLLWKILCSDILRTHIAYHTTQLTTVQQFNTYTQYYHIYGLVV